MRLLDSDSIIMHAGRERQAVIYGDFEAVSAQKKHPCPTRGTDAFKKDRLILVL